MSLGSSLPGCGPHGDSLGCESLQIRVNAKKEVMHGVDVSQKVDMEFVVKTMQCEDCTRSFTEQTWKALVQVSVSQLGTADPDLSDFDGPHILNLLTGQVCHSSVFQKSMGNPEVCDVHVCM